MVKYHYTYILRLHNGQEYIGVRSSTLSPELDSKYLGSSKYIKKQDVAFKSIIDTFETRQEAIRHEIELHDRYDVCRNPSFANRAKQTATGFDSQGRAVTEETRAKLREAHKDNPKYLGHKNSLGRILSDVTRQKIRQKALGREVTQEARLKMSLSHRNQTTSEALRKARSERMSGLNHPKADKTIYTFEHSEFGKRTCTSYDLRVEFNLYSGHLSAMIRRERNQVKGWRLFK